MTNPTLARKYVRGMKSACDDKPVNGIIYVADGDEISPYLQENLHIEEVNRAEGRWLLVCDRSNWITDDLADLEAKLMEFAGAEGYDVSGFYRNGFGPLSTKMETEK
jgi:hypothetical protein